MQTFLPYPDFTESLACLDTKRLGKQRLEAWQILNTIYAKQCGDTAGWSSHPAILMWERYVNALKHYYNTSLIVWAKRGYCNQLLKPVNVPNLFTMPPWLGNAEFHDSHKSNLLRKNPEHYSKYNWDVPNNLRYVWPVERK